MLGAYQNTRALHKIPKENLTFLSFPDEESNGLVRNGGYYGDELGFPGGSDSRRPGFDPCVGKIPWRRAWQPIPVFLPRESSWTEVPGELQSMGSQRVGHN